MTRTAIWLRIFCAALLLSLGFGHKPLPAAPSADPSSAHYLLPDGTFAGLCIDGADHGKPERSWPGSGCDICRVASGILLPTPSGDHARLARGHCGIGFRSRAIFGDIATPRPSAPVRGPPSAFA